MFPSIELDGKRLRGSRRRPQNHRLLPPTEGGTKAESKPRDTANKSSNDTYVSRLCGKRADSLRRFVRSRSHTYCWCHLLCCFDHCPSSSGCCCCKAGSLPLHRRASVRRALVTSLGCRRRRRSRCRKVAWLGHERRHQRRAATKGEKDD